MVHTDGAAADVLVAGAGPVGLTAAAELRRRGIACRIVDRLPARLPYAKAVGIQPRTLEIWDRMGFVQAALEAAVPMRGQLTYVNGVEQPRLDMVLPSEVPYGFAALPQYETERIIEEFLERFGTRIERAELVSFVQDADGVTSRLVTAPGEEELRTRFLVGCDGAHSTVRKGLGLTFEGGASAPWCSGRSRTAGPARSPATGHRTAAGSPGTSPRIRCGCTTCCAAAITCCYCTGPAPRRALSPNSPPWQGVSRRAGSGCARSSRTPGPAGRRRSRCTGTAGASSPGRTGCGSRRRFWSGRTATSAPGCARRPVRGCSPTSRRCSGAERAR